ncbi:MAG: hypothetical protein HY337_11550 [Gemmatimonadetes bacterium]|nr:hypothetical protein [Gemmatimonadota bacterium]
MTDLQDPPAESLEDRSTLQGELVCGRMASVYLAEALKHHGSIALTVVKRATEIES